MKCTELETWLHIRNRDSLGLGCLQENTDQDKGGALMGPHCVQTSLQTGCQLDASSVSCPPTRTSVSCFNLCLSQSFHNRHRRWGGWCVFSHNAGSYKSKTKVLTNSVCGERSFCLADNCHVAVSSHGLSVWGGRGAGGRERERAVWCLVLQEYWSYQIRIRLLWPRLILISFIKSPFPSRSCRRLELPYMDFGGHTNI